jgi:transcriptional repressor NrdR
VSIEVVDRVVEAIERKISELCLKEIPSRQIGDHIMEALRAVDKIAYVRFASVYREFSDVSQFVDTLKGLEEIKIAAEQSKKEKAALKDAEASKALAESNIVRVKQEVGDKCSLE